jgi:aryl-alcohol dehydrogenase-like predicted oxidoreductase
LTEDETQEQGFRERLSVAGEEALGEIAQALLDNPLFNQALATALGAGERAFAAQRSAMSALNIPSASDIERLERRVRSVSNRLEAVEDRLDELDDAVAPRHPPGEPARTRAEADQDSVAVPDPDA